MRVKSDLIAVGLADVHLDPFDKVLHPAYCVAREYVFDIKPDILIFMGDMGEFASLSSWNKKKPLIQEGRRYKDDYEIVKDELRLFRYKLPDTDMVYIIGNHEKRVDWYVEKQPEQFGNMDVVTDLGLEEMGMTVVRFNEAYQLGQLYWAHGWFYNKYHAAKTLHEFGDNIVYGHVHSLQQETRNVHFARKEQIAQCVGCLTDRYPDWKSSRPTRFQNGHVTVEYNHKGEFTMYPHIIINGEFSYGGYKWKA